MITDIYTDYTAADLIDAEEDARHAETEWLMGWRIRTERADYLPSDED